MSVRIQFDLSDEEWERASKYIPSIKSRHDFGYIALMEWVNRKDGRDKRAIIEREAALKEIIKPIVLEVLENAK